MMNAVKVGDTVVLVSCPSFGWQGRVDAVFPSGTDSCNGQPWAWVKWANGADGACKLADLEKVG